MRGSSLTSDLRGRFPAMTDDHPVRRLERKREGRVLAGVGIGLSEYFDVGVLAVRIALWFLGGLILYVVLWALMPDEGDTNRSLSPGLFWLVVVGSLALQFWAIASYL